MKRLLLLISFAEVSLLYNCALLLSVTLNLAWAKPRAAGGQFETFPIGIRIIYLGMFVGMIFLMFFLWRHRIHPLDSVGVQLSRIVGYVFSASTLVQLISRSSQERFNALPAAVIALTFLLLAARDRKR